MASREQNYSSSSGSSQEKKPRYAISLEEEAKAIERNVDDVFLS